MKLQSKRAWQVFLAGVLLLISCDISTFAASPQIPTPIPGAISLLAAQTAAEAATETAALIPPTLTPTLTPFPTQTPADTPSATPTFVFLLPTLSPVATSTNPNPGFACDLVKQSPNDEAALNPNQNFTLTWKIQNSGSKAWDQNDVTLNYIGGDKFSYTTLVNLPNTVPINDTVSLSVGMTAPGHSGKYTTDWGLDANNQAFCTLFLKITVR